MEIPQGLGTALLTVATKIAIAVVRRPGRGFPGTR